MRSLLTVIISFTYLNATAQFDYIDQSKLYLKHGIKQVNSFFHYFNNVENDEVWKIDSRGRIIYNELLPVDDDSSYSATIWTYKKGHLMEEKQIGTWSIKSTKLDTALTVYFYDQSHNLIKETYSHSRYKDTTIREYNYHEGLLIYTKQYNPNKQWWFRTDTIIYYSTKVPKLKITTHYHKDLIEYQKEQFYDTLGLIQVEIEYTPKGKSLVPYRTKTFIYTNQQLVNIKEVTFRCSFSDKVYTNDIIYEYNKKGLVSKLIRKRDQEIVNYDTFEYH